MSDLPKPPKEWLFDIVSQSAYWLTQFDEDVEMPNPDQYAQTEEEPELTEDFKQKLQQSGLKEHPLAQKSVYFSGVAEARKLPHQSIEAVAKQLELEYKKRLQFTKKFDPKPM